MTNKPKRTRLGLMATRLATLALPLALMAGCGGDDSPPPVAPTATVAAATQTSAPSTATRTAVPTQTQTAAPSHTATLGSTATSTATPVPSTPTPTVPNSSAAVACQKLTGCGQCFINSTGQCIADDDCTGRLSADAAICVNGISGCDATTLGDCLFLGCDGSDATGSCQ